MAINLETLSPTELKALIADAQSQMQAAHANHVKEVREKIERLLKSSGLTLADVYPARGGKGAKGPKSVVAPKYRNPANAAQTWSGRGKRPLWFVQALKKRGTTAESLLIEGAPKAAPAKAARKGAARKVAKTAARKAAKKTA
ncbi:H-NS histone family protein [Rhodanobacter sp. KK11]|uniref:H-NS histone family protein n=1 Tax=Rhodanobacter sp. KK11 TaxID=3083255 RepID=UPI002965F718|nr:H-NS histone family protein [Rhodanobacter sp. KK11]MDW2982840.1 H-NS histone family protein [Rhodanobacter sp. KK11]